MVDWGYQVVPDTRAVAITRDGAHGETVDANGNTHGDTTYSYYSWFGAGEYGPIHNANLQDFHTVFTGGWSLYYPLYGDPFPNVIWQWTPSGSYWTTDQFHVGLTMPDGSMGIDVLGDWTGQGAPSPYNVSYSATDHLDGATANPVYYLTVHEPLEKNYADQATLNVRENIRSVSGWVRNNTPSPTDLSLYLENSVEWSLSAGFNSDIGKWFLRTIGVDVSFTWAHSTNIGMQVTAPNVPPGYGTYLEAFDVYDHHDGIVDTWDAGGYTGTAPYHDKVPSSPFYGIQVKYPYVFIP